MDNIPDSVQKALDNADRVLAGKDLIPTTEPLYPVVTYDSDLVIKSLQEQVNSMVKWAMELVITTSDDVKNATADLSLVSKLKKAVEEKRQEYIGPLNAQLKEINGFFKQLIEPIGEADRITRKKILDYNAEVDRKRREAERIEEEKLRLAREEAALKGGEITIDLTPIQKPDETPSTVRTDFGDMHKTGTWKYEVVDFSAVPDAYKVIDSAQLNAIARKHHDQKPIPGIRFYFEPGLRVNAR